MRVRLDLAYDGTEFAGWAVQPGLRTIEGELTAALITVLRLADPVRIVVAGRTDAGVHARAQVAHVDIPVEAFERVPGHSSRPPAAALADRLRGILPRDITVRGVSRAPEGFEARFSAVHRRYSYQLCTDPGALDPVRRREVWLTRGPIDVDALRAASAELMGLKDFAAFCRRRERATTIRTLQEFSWTQAVATPGLITATLIADAFCHTMVRSLIGAVLEVGRGDRDVDWIRGMQASAIRDPMSPVVPAWGLSLDEVAYPRDAELAARARDTRNRRQP